jgi:type II secretory pathway pseudopilin PulG
MKPVAKQIRHGKAFTIVELLTVMSIIVILIGLLVPALNKVKQYARNVKQKAQFHSIEAAMELFDSQFGGYPDSTYSTPGATGTFAYCGAEKLAEAMMGRDLMGYHPDSTFRSDRTDGLNRALYTPLSLAARAGPFLPLENANAYSLGELYKNFATLNFDPCDFVLCDVYDRVTNIRTGRKVGMPVLYYKANTSKQSHNLQEPDYADNIYNWRDNEPLLRLGMPFDTASRTHRLLSYTDPKGVVPAEPLGKRFYWNIRNEQVSSISRPYRADSYILISAGWDGEYGTADDICNFEWRFTDRLLP